MNLPQPSTLWQNLKTDNTYLVIGFARHSETLESLVLYMGEDCKVWALPLPLWHEKFKEIEP